MTSATVRPVPTPLPAPLQVALTAISAFAAWICFRAVLLTLTYDMPCGNPLMALWFLATTASAVALLIAAFDASTLRRAGTVGTARHWARARLLLSGFALTTVAARLLGLLG